MFKPHEEYEITVRPDGTWSVHFLLDGGERSTHIDSGQVDTSYENVMGRGEEAARARANLHKSKRREAKIRAEGTRTLRIDGRV